eukprot:11485357-Ditylum_brightwellii.AAC.1
MIKTNSQINIRGSKKDCQTRPLTMGIDLKKVDDKILEGLVGKPKGMKQVAFKHGFVDLENLQP